MTLKITFGKAPAIVSKRNQFSPADELAENAMCSLPEQFQNPEFSKWLVRYTETVIRRVASYFGVAAQRGIEQTGKLLCDPDFYATRKAQRVEWKRKVIEQRAAQEWERLEKRSCPTAEQIAEQIKWLENEISGSRQRISDYEIRLTKLRATVPKNIRMMPKATQ